MAQLISAMAQLLWPLIALMALLVFRRAIGRVLRTAEKRELEFEVGGQKLTMHQVNDQQNEMIQDLQRQLATMSAELETRDKNTLVPSGPPNGQGNGNGDSEGVEPELIAEPQRLPPAQAPAGPEPFAVLWVSEQPATHALLTEQLRSNGVQVTLTTNTDEALAALSERPYRLVVSDMSRKENDRYHADAGLELLQELRDLGIDTPVIVFTGDRARKQYGARARQHGAVATTSSTYEMFKHFRNFDLL